MYAYDTVPALMHDIKLYSYLKAKKHFRRHDVNELLNHGCPQGAKAYALGDVVQALVWPTISGRQFIKEKKFGFFM